MPAASTGHPTDDALRAFVLGKLPDPEEEAVEDHLSACPACLARAAAARPDDTLLSLVAAVATKADGQRTAAAGPDATPAESDPTRAWDAPAARGGGDPPAALRDHPRYRPVRLLGRGGMGEVWLAEHAVMRRPVALKVIHPALLDRPGAAERFCREVRAAAKVHHPNIVTAFDADEAGGTHFLVMEYVPGETLLDAVRRGPLPVQEACRAVRDAANGLAAAHAAGLVHRDVKPANLIRAADGTVKVLDFGLVAAAAGDAGGLTGEGATMGTPDYVAPEQADAPAAADARSDVYALGCTLYHLLAGRVPYPDRSVLRKLDAHRDPAASPAPVPGLPPGLAGVLARMTATDPAARYPSAAAAADALAPFCDDTGLPTPAAAARPARRRRVWAAVAASLALVATAAAGVVYTIKRENAEIRVTTDDRDIEVVMLRNGDLIRIVDRKTGKVTEVDTEKWRLTPDGGGLTVDLPERGPTVFRRDGKTAVTVERVSVPPAAVPPAVPPAIPPAVPSAVPTVRPYRGFPGHLKPGWQVALSPDGKTVYSAGGDGYVRAWDVESGRETAKFDHQVRVIAVAVAEGGRTLLTVTAPENRGPTRLWAWDAATGQEAAAFPPLPPAEHLNTVAVAPGGVLAATFAQDGTVRVYDVAGRKQLRTWRVPARVAMYAVAWSADGRLLATSSDYGFTLTDATTGRPVHRITDEPDEPTWIAFSADDTQVYAVGWLGNVRVFDRTTGRLARVLDTKEARGNAGTHGAVAPDGRLLLAAHTADVRVWDPRADRPVARLTDAGLDSTFVAISADGRLAAAGSVDGKVRVWKMP